MGIVCFGIGHRRELGLDRDSPYSVTRMRIEVMNYLLENRSRESQQGITFDQHAEHQMSDTINQRKATAERKYTHYGDTVHSLEDYARETRGRTSHMCCWGDALKIMLLSSILN